MSSRVLNRMVAVCDLQGFSDHLKKHGTEREYERYLKLFTKAVHHAVVREAPRKEISNPEIIEEINSQADLGVACFSDTVVFYSVPGSRESIRRVIEATAWLIFELLVSPRMPVRAGIDFGPMIISEELRHYVGEALVGAHEMEQEQQWFGGALTKAAVSALPDDVLEHLLAGGRFGNWPVVAYEVPMKEGGTRKTLAVNWTWGIHNEIAGPQELPPDCDNELRQKVRNTEAFHRSVCQMCDFEGEQ